MMHGHRRLARVVVVSVDDSCVHSLGYQRRNGRMEELRVVVGSLLAVYLVLSCRVTITSLESTLLSRSRV